MKATIYTIEKSVKSDIDPLVKSYQKMALPYGKIELVSIFNKAVAKAQQGDAKEARASYSQAFEPYLKGVCIALDVEGEMVDSYDFAALLTQHAQINFFIAGAHGFEKEFLNRYQKVISLSRLTYAHQIAKVVLVEQIYRGLTINGGHPYHK